MRQAVLICVGRLKTPFWKEAADYYRRRLQRTWRIREFSIKNADPSLPPGAVRELEGTAILSALPVGHTSICLDEHGHGLGSLELAQRLDAISAPPCFIIGGAWGLAERVLAGTDMRLSLGQLTLPHELAQVVLWEQLFRVDSILRRSGYHH